MDLRRYDNLRTVISGLFAIEVERAMGGRLDDISPSAFLPLIEPGLKSNQKLGDVDERRLRLALRAVASNLDDVVGRDRVLEAAHVHAAMRRSSCHYLWFC